MGLGIGGAIAAIGAGIGEAGAAVGGVLGGLGVGTATAGLIGSGLVDAAIGAGAGSALGAATGGDPGLGALTGALTGGSIGGFGGLVGTTLGVGVTAGDALVGAGAGALGADITGGNPLTGALSGAGSGLLSGALGDFTANTTTPTGAAAGGATAPGPSAAGIGGGAISVAPTDLTAAGAAGGTAGGLSVQPTAGIGGAGLDSLASTAAGGAITPSTGLSSDIFGTAAGGSGAASLGGGGAGGGLTAPSGPASGGITPVGPNDLASVTAQAAGQPASGGTTIDTALADPSAHNILRALGANAGPLVAGGGLVANMLSSSNPTGLSELKGQAGALLGQGDKLSSYLQSGKLPPGAQAALTEATNSAKARVRSQYASMGMSGSSAEAQDLNNIDLQASSEQFRIADELLQTGLKETGMATSIYDQLLQYDTAQSEQTGSAIASLAAALAGGGRTIHIGG